MSQNSQKNIMIVDTIDKNKERRQARFVTKNSRSSESNCVNTSCLFTILTRLKLYTKNGIPIQTVFSCGISEI